MVSMANWSNDSHGTGLRPENKWETDNGCGQKGTHEKSFNWNDPTDGLWDKLLQQDLN